MTQLDRHRSLGQVLDFSGTTIGTCFQVKPGLLITAAHVLEQIDASVLGSRVPVQALIGDDNREPVIARLKAKDQEHDLAVLAINASTIADCVPGLIRSDSVAIGTKVVITGYPQIDDGGHEYQFIDSPGIWQGQVARDSGLRLGRIVADALIPGMSGAPVCQLSDGRVVGILSGRFNSSDGWLQHTGWIARTEDAVALIGKDSSLLLVDQLERGKAGTSTHSRPRQLPAATPQLVGRQVELARISTFICAGSYEYSGPKVVAITGTAGVGKTAIAVHWARENADRFLDGQLYIDLRGFSPSDPSIATTDAIRRFLDALQVSPDRIPAREGALPQFFRSLTADSALLIVLDNAANADHVRDLIPGSQLSAVVITSRDSLDSLVVREGAYRINLDLLEKRESVQLIESYLDDGRVVADQDSAGHLAAHCAGLPLALTMLAARLAQFPRTALRFFREQLEAQRFALLEPDFQNPSDSLREVFSWSFKQLSEKPNALFLSFGIAPVHEIDIYGASSLLGTTIRESRAAVSELAQANLFDEFDPGRYRCHDLLRQYAAMRATDGATSPAHSDAMMRLFSYYVQTSASADKVLDPNRELIRSNWEGPAEFESPRFISPQAATEWFQTERSNIMALLRARRTTEAAFGNYLTLPLAWSIASFLDKLGHWADLVSVCEISVESAEGSPLSVQATTIRQLGHAYARVGRFDESSTCQENALQIERQLGDKVGQAKTLHRLGWACERERRYSDALSLAEEALELYRAAGNSGGEGHTLSHFVWNYARSAKPLKALEIAPEAVRLCRLADDKDGEAVAFDGIGFAQLELERLEAAADALSTSVQLWGELNDISSEAVVRSLLARVRRAQGDIEEAKALCDDALAVLEPLEHPEVATILKLRATLAKPEKIE